MKSQKRKHESEGEDKLTQLLFNKPADFAEKLKPKHQDVREPSDRKVAWVDEDDEAFESTAVNKASKKGLYKDTLKRKYETLIGTPSWACLNKKVDKEDEEEDVILRSVGHVQRKKSVNLQKGFLETKSFPKLRIPHDTRPVSCLEFHPTATVALMGTRSGNIAIFSVGGEVNNKLHSFQLQKYSPTTSYFTPDGNQCFISSAMKHKYCVYDLIKAQPTMVELPIWIKKPNTFVLSPNGEYLAVGNGFQEIFIISAASKELIRELKHNSNVNALAFNNESNKIYSYCEQGEVCIWDMSTFRVLQKFYDNGCITASTINTSPCGRLLATGSGEGIVNIYETDKITSTEPVPLKTIKNLKSKITHLKFNSTSEILSLASSILPDAAKLTHIPSYHVFVNFPPQEYSLNHIEKVSFSPNSGFMGVANNSGSVHLFRLKHYKNY